MLVAVIEAPSEHPPGSDSTLGRIAIRAEGAQGQTQHTTRAKGHRRGLGADGDQFISSLFEGRCRKSRA